MVLAHHKIHIFHFFWNNFLYISHLNGMQKCQIKFNFSELGQLFVAKGQKRNNHRFFFKPNLGIAHVTPQNYKIAIKKKE